MSMGCYSCTSFYFPSVIYYNNAFMNILVFNLLHTLKWYYQLKHLAIQTKQFLVYYSSVHKG